MKEFNATELAKPFAPEKIQWRVKQSGLKDNKPWAILIPYIDARDVQNRLDEILGPQNWSTKYTRITDGFLCELSIRISDEWVTKSDGSEETEFEGVKGGLSRSLCRAASAWGIGRYLYDSPITFGIFVDKWQEGALKVTIAGRDYYCIASSQQSAPKPSSPSSIPKALSSTSNAPMIPQKAPVPECKPGGDHIIQFGQSWEGRRLDELDIDNLNALIGFFKKIRNPQGKAASTLDALLQFLNGDLSFVKSSA